jgi:hypothetical protein
MKSCCEHHTYLRPDGCRQGRDCPARQACELPEDEPDEYADHVEAICKAALIAIAILVLFVWVLPPEGWARLVAWMAI